MDINVERIWDGDVLTLVTEGRLDTNTSPELVSIVKTEAEEASRVIFDFEKLDYISSAGLRVIVTTAKMMAGRDGIAVKNLSEEVYEVFELVGLTGLLEID